MKSILFVCVHNAGRSQMAKAMFNGLAEQRDLPYRAESAGTEPSDHVYANVAEAMAELGVDVSSEQPQTITNAMIESAERIITMGCAVDSEVCPAIRIKDVEDWGLPDPAGQPPARVRQIRQEVARRVQALLDTLA